MTFASVGVRGGYNAKNYERGLAALEAWAVAQDEWRVVGAPRYLGYNSPFVPRFARYAEVQAPVERAGTGSAAP